MGQNQRSNFTPSRLLRCRIPLAVNNVVFRIWSLYRAGKTQQVSIEVEVGRRFITEKFIARFEYRFVQNLQIFSGCVSVARILFGGRPIFGPFESPVERADHPVGGAEAETVLPILHPSCVQIFH